MIWVIFVVLLVIGIIGTHLFWKKSEWVETVGAAMQVIGYALSVIAAIAGIITTCCAINSSTLDERIAMYQEENQIIELQIADVVKQYQEYETGIFTEVAPDKSIALVALYPELKSDSLVQKQIEVYVDNNTKIKELKEALITARLTRWWAYFGK